jgi:uncharacterized protein
MAYDADAIIVGAGLAGLVAAAELIEAGKRVIVLDQEPDSRWAVRHSGRSAGFFWSTRRSSGACASTIRTRTRSTIGWERRPSIATRISGRGNGRRLMFAVGEKRAWLHERGVRFFPFVGWAERGGHNAIGHGNSVPRFHLTWGTGPGVVAPFIQRVREGEKRGRVVFKFRHRVNELVKSGAAVDGVRGDILEPWNVGRGQKSSRQVVGGFELRAQAVIVASGGIGASHELIRKNWPQRLGPAPKRMITGVPDHVDGRMLAITAAVGGTIINPDRMWHYVEGIKNWNPIWTAHAIRILPGPSSLWLDARGRRLPAPLYPGFDTLGTLKHIMETGYDYSWFILTQQIIEKEFALSGSEQNPDFTGKSWRKVLGRARGGVPGPVKAFMDKGEDFIVERELTTLVKRMNALAGGEPLLSVETIQREIAARDRQLDNPCVARIANEIADDAAGAVGDEATHKGDAACQRRRIARCEPVDEIVTHRAGFAALRRLRR